jgi:hypothetical protein
LGRYFNGIGINMPQLDTLPAELRRKIISYLVPEIVNGRMQVCDCLEKTRPYGQLHCCCMPNDGWFFDTFNEYLGLSPGDFDFRDPTGRPPISPPQLCNETVVPIFAPLWPLTTKVNRQLRNDTIDVLKNLPESLTISVCSPECLKAIADRTPTSVKSKVTGCTLHYNRNRFFFNSLRLNTDRNPFFENLQSGHLESQKFHFVDRHRFFVRSGTSPTSKVWTFECDAFKWHLQSKLRIMKQVFKEWVGRPLVRRRHLQGVHDVNGKRIEYDMALEDAKIPLQPERHGIARWYEFSIGRLVEHLEVNESVVRRGQHRSSPAEEEIFKAIWRSKQAERSHEAGGMKEAEHTKKRRRREKKEVLAALEAREKYEKQTLENRQRFRRRQLSMMLRQDERHEAKAWLQHEKETVQAQLDREAQEREENRKWLQAKLQETTQMKLRVAREAEENVEQGERPHPEQQKRAHQPQVAQKVRTEKQQRAQEQAQQIEKAKVWMEERVGKRLPQAQQGVESWAQWALQHARS